MLRSYVYDNYMTQMVYGITYILHIVIMGLMTLDEVYYNMGPELRGGLYCCLKLNK